MTFRVASRLVGMERTLIRRFFDAAPADAINLGLGQPDLPTPPGIGAAGIDAIRAGRTGYTTTAGREDLRTAIAAACRMPATAAEVVVTVGSQEAMFAALSALIDPGDEILTPDPGYPAYPALARLLGARSIGYRLHAADGFRLRAAEIERRLTERTRAVIVCEPSNPTGACSSRDELRAVARLLEARGIPWISDEIYAGFDYDGTFVSLGELAPGHGLVVSSLSKDAAMAGWRLGWVVAPSAIAERITVVHQYLVTCAPSPAQAAALYAFGEAGRRERSAVQERFRTRRDRVAALLQPMPGLRWERPDGAFYYFVDVSSHGDDLEIARRILAAGVIVIPGVAFGEGGRGFVRISFAADETDLDEGLRRIAAVLDGG